MDAMHINGKIALPKRSRRITQGSPGPRLNARLQ
jgi:hypothetical protein